MALCRPLARSARSGLRQHLTAGATLAPVQTRPIAKGIIAKMMGWRKQDKEAQKNEDWSSFSVEQWRSAAYCTKSYFAQLAEDTEEFVGALCDELGGAGESGPLLIEVGCGTGDALLPLGKSNPNPRCRYAAGVDFNPKFIEFCKEQVPEKDKDRIIFLAGDAQELVKLASENLPKEWNVMNRPKVVTCLGNTIGIIPDAIRPKVYKQMMELAGPSGYFVVVYWNGNAFGDAVQNFYHKNPQLCGEFKGDSIDLRTCTLTTPSGYRTHWTKPDEAKEIFEKEIGAKVISLKEMGRGVLVAGRVPTA